jgi:hypothetical protein
MKKIIGITILMVFLLGIIPSGILAKENGLGNEKDDGNIEEMEQNEAKNQGEDSEIQTQEQGTDDEDETDNKNETENSNKKTWKERFEKVKANKVRALSKIKVEKAKENFLKAQAKFEQVKLNFEESKLRWEEAKKERKECTENCTEKETKLIEHVKEIVKDSADKMISHLEKVKSKIESNEELNETKVDAATTREELKEIAKEINQAWSRVKEQERLAVNLNARSSLVNLMEKLGKLGDDLELSIADAKTAGTEVGGAETYMAEFDAKMVLAEENYQKLNKKIEEAKAKTGDEKLSVLKEAKTYFENMRNNLKDAHEALKKAYKELKTNGIKPNILKEVD